MINNRKGVLVTGGASFLGSHLCDRLLKEAAMSLCVDNFIALKTTFCICSNPHFEMMRHDVTFPLYTRSGRIYNLALSLRHPSHYQWDPGTNHQDQCTRRDQYVGSS